MKDNLIEVIKYLGFEQSTNNKYEKTYINVGYKISIDLKNEKIEYPEGITVHDHTTCNFDNPENFVVLECVDRLLEKGYRPEHLELERKWSLGHEKKSGKADICVLDSNGKYVLFIVECKTAGTEYKKARKILLNDGGQLFSYWQQERSTEWLILYASDFVDNKIEYFTESISCKDDSNIVEVAKKDTSVKLYKDAYTTSDLFEVWKETYEKRFAGDVIFRDDSTAYKIGIKPLRKSDLKDFGEKDKIVNKFEEILRHNNVSDKENAFNRLIALFIAKLVDEIQKSETDIVEFQYKIGTDTYETLQDRLQRLHKEGMERFMREEIYYVADDYAEQVIQSYTGQKRTKLIEELKNTIRVLKFYTNNDFAFKDVHNEELFYQNGKILVEMVQLFENYRIIGSNNLQMLGDMFEQLLNKGFKQNEGQFFTPVPITRFIWAALPISSWMNSEENDYPKIIDYACGAGHFLTEGVKSISSFISDEKKHSSWVEKSIYGIEKDYRLARVSKISLFMHGAGDGNIIFGDGLDNYPEKEVKNNSFDILVANPPYSVSAFKPHLNLKNNNVEDFSAYPHISNEGKEIEVMFTERISQLLKAKGIAAVILPSPILNKEQDSFVKAREIILKNFNIRAICNLGDKTFGATGTNTVILFLEKFSEPPIRKDEVYDSVQAIFENQSIEQFEDKEIYNAYLTKIGCPSDEYVDFIKEDKDFDGWENNNYFSSYYKEFITSTENGPKLKQKSFKNLSEDDKKIELNRMFYTRVKDIEKEKMEYFAYVYKQTTLIVNAPEKKLQEKFLGYSWSTRKGQEGIQILNLGGMLFNPEDRLDENKIAYLIREMFSNRKVSNKNLSDYYYYLRTQDMLDFSGISFKKGIKTVKVRDLKSDINLTSYKLADKEMFELQIGSRVLASELDENGIIPVISANVKEEFGKINKNNITDFSVDSVLWGIDGDWMVGYIEKDKPFYPTDHCGVIRIKNDKMLSKYLMYALDEAGKFESFSRSNRASTERIKSLTIQAPSLAEQNRIISKFNALDKEIQAQKAKIEELDQSVKSKFVEMFDLDNFIKTGTNSSYNLEEISTLCEDGRGRIISKQYIDNNPGEFPVYSSQTSNEGILGYINSYDFEGEYLTWTTDGANAGKVFHRNGKFNCTNVCGTLKIKDVYKNQVTYKYLNEILNKTTKLYVSKVGNNKLMNSAMKKIPIPLPPIELQNEFASYVEEIDKLKFEAEQRQKELEQEKENLITKYFR